MNRSSCQPHDIFLMAFQPSRPSLTLVRGSAPLRPNRQDIHQHLEQYEAVSDLMPRSQRVAQVVHSASIHTVTLYPRSCLPVTVEYPQLGTQHSHRSPVPLAQPPIYIGHKTNTAINRSINQSLSMPTGRHYDAQGTTQRVVC